MSAILNENYNTEILLQPRQNGKRYNHEFAIKTALYKLDSSQWKETPHVLLKEFYKQQNIILINKNNELELSRIIVNVNIRYDISVLTNKTSNSFHTLTFPTLCNLSLYKNVGLYIKNLFNISINEKELSIVSKEVKSNNDYPGLKVNEIYYTVDWALPSYLLKEINNFNTFIWR